MATLLVSASDIIDKTGIDLTVLQSAIDEGCYCYSRANACHVKVIREAIVQTPTGIDLNIYGIDQYDLERYETSKRLDHVFFKPKEICRYIESEFGEERAIEFAKILIGCEQEQVEGGSPGEFRQEKNENKYLDPRRRNSYLKMLAAALCPKGNRQELGQTGLAGKLTSRMEQLGISLSDDAARSIIDEVIDFLEKNQK